MDEWVCMRKSYISIALLSLIGCSSSFGTAEDPSADAGDAGLDKTTGNPLADAGADAAPEAPPVVSPPPPDADLNENYGIFVSLVGTPNGDGTRANPLLSIQAAIGKAKPSGKHVYVCKGTYKEALTLENGISVIGGYDCTGNWAIDNNGRSRIESPTIPAIRANNIVVATSFMGFDVIAPDASVSGTSSIGLIAQNAGSLRIANGSITAGKGADGAPGTTPAPPVNGTDVDGKQGGSICSLPFPLNMTSTCPTTAAAKGGTSTCGGETGGAGTLAPFYGGDYPACSIPTVRAKLYEVKSGNAGQAGTDGISANATGAFNANGYVSADGTPGKNGSPGYGGSGGKFADYADTCKLDWYFQLSSGSGGGAGGCGGLAGTPGKGGGASIAALLSASDGLTFDAALVLAGQGGAGGKGSLGSLPTAGGAAGAPLLYTGAPQPGGPGGRPGISGSGAGGPSIGVAYTGGMPTFVNGAKPKAGTPGAGVPEDSNTFQNVTWKLPLSAAGIAQDMYSF